MTTRREPISPDQPASPANGSPALQIILQTTASYYGLPIALLLGRRNRETSHVRHMALTLCLNLTTRSQRAIARKFLVDHASVRYARDRISSLCTSDPHIAKQYRELVSLLTETRPQPPPLDMLSPRLAGEGVCHG